MRLKDKVALVTGAGGGIGEATALRFAAEGAAVGVLDVNGEGAERVAAAINEQGGRAIGLTVDVSQKDQVVGAVERILAELGGLHCAVNNAGITQDKSAKKMDEEAWDRVLSVNLKGTFLVCQAAMQPMLEQGYGRISNTASVAVQGNFGQVNYSASKAGVVGLTRTLALECARSGVTVNCVAPGATDTPMFAVVPDEIKAAIVKTIPLRRMATPAEIASVHAFLCSDDAAYVTGQLLYADGGATLGT
jgi:3-oxoacyl-[acyl-carrier protein] reductase